MRVAGVEEVTVTEMEQEPGDPAGIVPPLRVIEFEVYVIAPPHCGVAGADATIKPAGKLSVKAARPSTR